MSSWRLYPPALDTTADAEGVEEAAVLSTEAGGLEAGRLRVWAGRGCVGSAILEDTLEVAVFDDVAPPEEDDELL